MWIVGAAAFDASYNRSTPEKNWHKRAPKIFQTIGSPAQAHVFSNLAKFAGWICPCSGVVRGLDPHPHLAILKATSADAAHGVQSEAAWGLRQWNGCMQRLALARHQGSHYFPDDYMYKIIGCAMLNFDEGSPSLSATC